MAFLTIQIETDGTPIADFNSIALNGDTTNPRAIVQEVINLLDGVMSGCDPSTIKVTTSTNAGTVSGQTGGVGPLTLNLK